MNNVIEQISYALQSAVNRLETIKETDETGLCLDEDINLYREAIQALEEIKETHILVPREPTEEMLIADAKSRKSQFENFGIVNSSICYKAMLMATQEKSDEK